MFFTHAVVEIQQFKVDLSLVEENHKVLKYKKIAYTTKV